MISLPAILAQPDLTLSEKDAKLAADALRRQHRARRHGLSIEQLFEPNVRFFVARLDGTAVGCGGVAMFEDYAEVKRMYTRPAARGRGVAKALLRRIEGEARAAGKFVLRLETGIRQQEAVGLYKGMGFRRRGPFVPYAVMPARNIKTSLFFEKVLG